MPIRTGHFLPSLFSSQHSGVTTPTGTFPGMEISVSLVDELSFKHTHAHTISNIFLLLHSYIKFKIEITYSYIKPKNIQDFNMNQLHRQWSSCDINMNLLQHLLLSTHALATRYMRS